MAMESIRARGITVELSKPDKVLFSHDNITKRDLAGYYLTVAGRMLPFLRDRPISMTRFPDGIDGNGIVQKNVPAYFPDWVTRTKVGKQGGTLQQVVCDKAATLVYLASQACIEVHELLSTASHLDRPDELIFDLDPPDAEHFGEARSAARALRRLLEDELGLTTFVKTTGGKGLHVHVPLSGDSDFDTARGFARQAAGLIAARNSDSVTTEQRRNKRGTRIYADVMRNAYAQTAVAPLAVRARPGAPVATPLHWDELSDSKLKPGRFTIATVPARLDELGRRDDPWAGLARRRRPLAEAQRGLSELAAA